MTVTTINAADREAAAKALEDQALEEMQAGNADELPGWYVDENERARRLAMALNARAAQKIGATVRAEASEPSVRSQHEDVIEGVTAALRSIIGLAEEEELEHARKQIVRGICSNIDWLIGDTDKRLSDRAERLADQQRRHKGGEVDDNRLIRGMEWMQKLEVQRDFYSDVMEAAIGVLGDLGEGWSRRPAPGAAMNANKTAAMAEATALIQRYRQPSKTAAVAAPAATTADPMAAMTKRRAA